MRILIVEDDKRIAINLAKILKRESFAIDCVHTGKEAGEKVLDSYYDLVILDLMLPDMDGFKVCSIIREEKIPSLVLMLTARSQLEDVVEGLNSGADDYLTKPFKIEELLARIRALMRRCGNVVLDPLINIHNLEIDTNLHKVFIDKKEKYLSPKEYALLLFLVRNKGRVIDRMSILSNVWDENVDLFSNTVDVHIRYLRKKIGDLGCNIIKTVKGGGYVLCGD